jgi:glycerophosphoryl diester phosphodiesterase
MLSQVPSNFPTFYKEGHRGTRGLMPENTIPSMIKAIELGANVIEVDIFTSKDGQVLVTHDKKINAEHSLSPEGKELTKEEADKFIFHQMNYADIRKFDVGMKFFKPYPQQKKIPAYIPLFSELIDSVEQFTKANNLPPTIYNIELKTDTLNDVIYNSVPQELVDKVIAVVKSRNLDASRYYIQSFDMRPLQYVHKKYPKVVIGFLTDNKKKSFEDNIKEMGFYPHIYSPHYNLITADLINKAHQQNVKVVPWTVNTVDKMKEMVALGVDGIITDYPNYFKEIGK